MSGVTAEIFFCLEQQRESNGNRRRKGIQLRPPRQLEAETRFKLRTSMVHEAQFLCVYDVLEQQTTANAVGSPGNSGARELPKDRWRVFTDSALGSH